MSTSKIFRSSLIAAVAAAAAFSASGAFASDNDYPGVQARTATSTLTRAQVRAEYLQAKRDGALPQTDDSYPVVTAANTAKSRAEVKQELAQALRDGYSVRIDNSYPAL
jgi:hypothetical protein